VFIEAIEGSEGYCGLQQVLSVLKVLSKAMFEAFDDLG